MNPPPVPAKASSKAAAPSQPVVPVDQKGDPALRLGRLWLCLNRDNIVWYNGV